MCGISEGNEREKGQSRLRCVAAGLAVGVDFMKEVRFEQSIQGVELAKQN